MNRFFQIFIVIFSCFLSVGCVTDRYHIRTQSLADDIAHKRVQYNQQERQQEQVITAGQMSLNKLNATVPQRPSHNADSSFINVGNVDGEAIDMNEFFNESTVSMPPQGYWGIVKNFDEDYRYNFVIEGVDVPLETTSVLLGPGDWDDTLFLLPGTYKCAVYYKGKQVGRPWTFHSELKTKKFLGRECHWYVYME